MTEIKPVDIIVAVTERRPGDAHYGRQVDDETKQERERLRQLIMKSRNGASSRRDDRLELPHATA